MRLSIWMVLLMLATPAWAQEPEPEQPAQPEQQPEQEPEQQPELQDPGVSTEDVMAAIEAVRETFVRVDRAWTEARSSADDLLAGATEEDGATALQDKLAAGLAESQQLVADLEKLLEMLPESDEQQQQQQQQQQQNQQQQQQDQQQNGDRDQNQDQSPDDEPNPNDVEGNREATEPAPGDLPPDAPPIFLAPGSGGGSWGHLPPRLQQTLQNAQAEDLPLRYRGLLEQFHKRRIQD